MLELHGRPARVGASKVTSKLRGEQNGVSRKLRGERDRGDTYALE